MQGRQKAIKKFFEILLSKDPQENNKNKSDHDIDFLDENVEDIDTQKIVANLSVEIEALIFTRCEKEAIRHRS